MSISSKEKCFTFTWTVENIIYYGQKTTECIRSPTFVINSLREWKYFLYLSQVEILYDNNISFHLHVEGNHSFEDLGCEFALLLKAGSVLTSRKFENYKDCARFMALNERKEIFVVNRSLYLPEDKLTVRCRIWKKAGEMTENVQCFARTRICIQKEAFLWDIQNYCSLQSKVKCTYQIKSEFDDEVLLTLDLLLNNSCTDLNSINIQLASENCKIKFCVLHLMPLSFGSCNRGIKKEFRFSDKNNVNFFIVLFSKKHLIANKDLCLPNDVLSFRCECMFFTGKILEKIERVVYDCDCFPTMEADNLCSEEKKSLLESKRILKENLKSLCLDNILCDIILKTNTETFRAHKSILSVRSPVFKEMFVHKKGKCLGVEDSNIIWEQDEEEEEEINECVDVKDLDSDTVKRMLHYIYTAEIQDLHWERACELYRAAAKYDIHTLKEECSAYLKSNLSFNNACEGLIFADVYQDKDLKAYVQNFIFNYDVINSEEWKKLMKKHLKLAADTMYLQIQRKTASWFNKTGFIETTFKFNSPTDEYIMFNPPTGTDTEMKGGVSISIGTRHQCITCMKEYENKSFEELRDDYYTTNRKECCTTDSTPIISTSSVSSKNLFNVTDTKKFPNELGLQSALVFSTSWLDSTIAKTTTVLSGLSSSNIKIPSENKEFDFKTVEKYLTSPVSFGNTSQKTPVESSFSFGNNSEKNDHLKTSFSFSSISDKASVNTPSLVGNADTSFSSNKKEPDNMPFSFVTNNDKGPSKPLFSFSKSSEKPIVKAFSSIGKSRKKKTSNILFPFGFCRETQPFKPLFSFPASDTKPNVSFTSSNEEQSFANTEEKQPINESFSSREEIHPVNLSFSSDNSGEKENVKESLPLLSCEKELVKESLPLLSCEKELVKESLSNVSSGEQKYAEESLPPFNSDEKEHVEESLPNVSKDEQE